MTCLRVYLFLDALNKAVNAVIAESVPAGRLILAAQQLEACRQKNNPYRDLWMPGLAPVRVAWAPDPCQKEQEEIQQLQNQGAAAGNQVATQQLGGAPAPQLASAQDPVPSTDPSIPANEYDIPMEGANNQWSPLIPEDVLDMIIDQMGDQPIDQEMQDDLMEMFKYVKLWCPWGGPATWNLKWKFKYHPKNSDWMGKWKP